MAESRIPWVVCKFGGTSVATRSHWDAIAEIARAHREEVRHPFLVCSALQGVSDRLEALLREAERGDPWSTIGVLRDRHRSLARDLNVEGDAILSEGFERLETWTRKIQSEGTASPRQRAAVLATGELLSTRLGAAYLSAQGLPVQWLDARAFLRAKEDPRQPPRRQYLAADCASHPDPVLQAHLADTPDAVYITQGYIASNALDETVLLGRGGSDTSAAYFAAKLEADRLEIWTDVPGLFTANPHEIPSARLLRRLDYEEAQEIATMGGTVLHPRCISPVQRHGIPLHVRSTETPAAEGTVVSGDPAHMAPQVKAISSKTDVVVVSMETLGMWQEVGFLAEVFQIFKQHGLSVDLVATSEANVTVTLDSTANALEPDTLDRLMHDLNRACRAEIIESCAVVSLVGRRIRSLLSELGPAFEVFDEQKVHLVTQAASDLNMSFVVDEEQAPRLVQKLHTRFFGAQAPDVVFGPQWQEVVDDGPEEKKRPDVWWRRRRDALLRLAREHSPRYVYDEATLRAKGRDVSNLSAADRTFYAVKANPHPDVLRVLDQEGVGFECVSPGELDRVFRVLPDLDPERVLFQPNFAEIKEYDDAFDRGVHVTLDNIQPLAEHPSVFAGEEFFVRVDPGRGQGHHQKVRTAGRQSKFGVVPGELARLRAAADRAGATIVGLHAHVGSGITEEETWAHLLQVLASFAAEIPTVQVLNVGGGLGVPDRASNTQVEMDVLDESLGTARRRSSCELWMEPGRYVVAEAGVLLARVTQTKAKDDVQYVGIDTGMNSLLRPALYGAHHEIVNLTRLDESPSMTAEVVGPICETGDVLGHDRRLPPTEPGDVLLVGTAGAYGASMSNRYNLRAPAEEVLLTKEDS